CGLHQTGAGGKTGLSSEGRWGDPVAVRVLADSARGEDSGGAPGAARLQRPQSRGLSLKTQKGAEGFLSRTGRSSAARLGQAADVRLRSDDLFRDRIAGER